MSAPLPKLPTLNLQRIVLLREKLNCNVIQPYESQRVMGDDFTTFVHKIHTEMPKVPYSTLFKSVQQVAGQLITPKVNRDLSWRLAGNQHLLRKGIVVPPYSRQLAPEWVPVQVWDVERKRGWKYQGDKKENNKVEKYDIDLDLLALAGMPAGLTLKFTRPINTFRRRGTKLLLGFTPYDKRLWNRYFVGDNNYPMQDVQQLVKLRFFIYLDPGKSKAGEPAYGWLGMNCSGSMRKWNRIQMKRRERQNFQCPKNYELAMVPCHKCEMGFDKCLAGCHSVTYDKKFCPKCKTVANFVNNTAEWCVDCVAKTA